jgi:hypothetical protein
MSLIIIIITAIIQSCLARMEHGCGCDLGEDVPCGHHGGFRTWCYVVSERKASIDDNTMAEQG